jgi:hypothetical protein
MEFREDWTDLYQWKRETHASPEEPFEESGKIDEAAEKVVEEFLGRI